MSTIDLTAEEASGTSGASLTPVLAEIWISFVGLTHSHLAALQTTGKLSNVKVLELSPNSFTAGDLNGNISVTVNPANGAGVYETKSCGGPGVKGTWHLNANGTASVGDSKEEDMELAVEFFAQKLVAARSEGAIR